VAQSRLQKDVNKKLMMIELRQLQKIIDQNTVLNIDSLDVALGEVAALVGPVDSGKDILLEILTGQSRSTAGEARIAGLSPRENRKQLSRQIGVLFAEDNLYDRLSADGNLKFYSRLRRLPKERSMEVLKLVGLADHAHVQLEEMSSSLKRRLAFGRAILHNPAVLFLFEPFNKCDDASVALLSDLIRQLASESVAILIMAEDRNYLDAVCDAVYVLEKGQIIDTYRPGEEQRADLPFMIPAKQEGKVDLVDPADIMYVLARDDRAYLQTAEDLLPTHFTLAALEKRLARSGFFRAHRGYLVNLQHVKEVIPFTRNSFSLRLKDAEGTLIPLSRAAAAELRELLGY
jgi:ABC-2 type transport system ATP-binding protein